MVAMLTVTEPKRCKGKRYAKSDMSLTSSCGPGPNLLDDYEAYNLRQGHPGILVLRLLPAAWRAQEDTSAFSLRCNITIDVNHLSEGIKLGLQDDREKQSQSLGRSAVFTGIQPYYHLPLLSALFLFLISFHRLLLATIACSHWNLVRVMFQVDHQQALACALDTSVDCDCT